MNASFLYDTDISHINKQAFENGLLKVMPSSFYKSLDENSLKLFMLNHGIYVIPTTELIDWLKENIYKTENIYETAIEIGAGLGTIARALQIPITDSRMQEFPDVKLIYNMGGQPTIKYPSDVEKLDYKEAIEKYKPKTVIGCFITHKHKSGMSTGNMYGVEEEYILKNVQRYINIGNLQTHKDKPILKEKSTEYNFDWLITRSHNQSLNRIWVYDQENNY